MSFWSTAYHVMAVITRSLTYTAGASFLLLSLLSPRSRRARLYLNVLLYVFSLGACSVLGMVVSPFMYLSSRSRLNVNWLVARSFDKLAGNLIGLRFTLEGGEKFAKANPAVVVGNHQTGVDVLYLGRVFPRQTSIMAKRELKYAPVLGQFMWLSGAVFIDRQSRKDAVQSFNQVAKAMKDQSLSLWVFPEGTRSNLPFPDLLPFKKGAFHLAVQAQVPIVPVVCENYHRYFDGKTRFESGTVRIRVLDPVETKGLTTEDVTDLTTKVREMMLAELQKMDADLDEADVASSSAKTNEAKTGVKAQVASPPRLGGIAKLASYLVGTGHGPNVEKKTAKQREKLVKPGTSGENPQDFNLVSEQDKGHTSATTDIPSSSNLRERLGEKAKTSPSNTSDETDESVVVVKHP